MSSGCTLRRAPFTAISLIFINDFFFLEGGGGGGGRVRMGVAGTLLMYTFTPVRVALLHSENSTRPQLLKFGRILCKIV